MFALPSLPASKLPKNAGQSEGEQENVSNTTVTKDTGHPPTSSKEVVESQKVKYTPPEWSAIPKSKLWLEVIKNGSIDETIAISKPYMVFGRVPDCDVVLNHQSISRFHAVLQTRADDAVFLFDLESTHSTFLNKSRIPPRQYVVIKPGHHFKFGGSSRMYFLCTNVMDREDEPITQRLVKKAQNASTAEPISVSWGFAEDAQGEPEEDIPSNPKAALEAWLRQHNQDISFSFTEQREGRELVHVAEISINVEGQAVLCSGRGGRKKEAEKEAINDAFRKLKLGQSSEHADIPSTVKKEALAKDDDLDDFFDRTDQGKGSRKRHKAAKTVTTETFDTLLVQYEEIGSQLRALNQELLILRDPTKEMKDTDGDDIDDYLRELQKKDQLKVVKQVESQIADMTTKMSRVLKLLKIADPVKTGLLLTNRKDSVKEVERTSGSEEVASIKVDEEKERRLPLKNISSAAPSPRPPPATFQSLSKVPDRKKRTFTVMRKEVADEQLNTESEEYVDAVKIDNDSANIRRNSSKYGY
ncbi:hypothetical protein HDU97_000178 [Phlyctochytrium planicorne]|nr:hypothetical protein HDU97_000178 [Phlyctochytrium planicorne]